MLNKKRPKSLSIFSKKNQKNFKNKINSKILEEYIQDYNILEKKLKQTNQELADTKTNLKISKEIIDTFMTKCSDPNFKFSEVIKSLNKKLNFYQKINSKLLEDNTTLNNLLNKYKLATSRINNDLEILSTKNFILEQSNKKKDNTIQNLKNIQEIKQNYIKILINPKEANIKLNNELEYYKELSENLIKREKKYKEKIDFYQQQINYLQTEKEKLRVKNKEQKIRANKDKDNIILYLRKTFNNMVLNDINFKKSFNQTGDSQNNNNLGYISILNTFNKSNLSRNKGNNNLESAFENFLNKTENNIYNLYEKRNNKNKISYIKNEEFGDILKQVGLSEQNFFRMSKNPKMGKLTDIIEFMYKIIREKTKTINLLECENENLNQENFELNKKNMELIKIQNNNNDNDNNSSMMTNNSKITIKNVNINTLSNYQKIFNNNVADNSDIQEEINKIFNITMPKSVNKESEKKNNINIVKFNNQKSLNKQQINNKNIINKQISFRSIHSSEVENEIGENSFLSDSSEK